MEKDYLLAIRGKDLHFCITEFWIRPNCWDYLRSETKLVDYLVDYHEFLDNSQDKTKRLLSLEKFMQIRTNPKVRHNPLKLSIFMKSPSVPYLFIVAETVNDSEHAVLRESHCSSTTSVKLTVLTVSWFLVSWTVRLTLRTVLSSKRLNQVSTFSFYANDVTIL